MIYIIGFRGGMKQSCQLVCMYDMREVISGFSWTFFLREKKIYKLHVHTYIQNAPRARMKERKYYCPID
jgi:hypothetical protein